MNISTLDNNYTFVLDLSIANKLLLAIDDYLEWTQEAILESIMTIYPENASEAVSLLDKIIPRLKHSNSSVSITAVRLVIYLTNFLDSAYQIKSYVEKCGPPLITLLNNRPEIQYISLKNINIILQKHKEFLRDEIKAI